MTLKTENTIPSRYANDRASWDTKEIYPILDEALFCTISYAVNNQAFSIPQSFIRVDNSIYIHGSVGSHFLRTLADGRQVCISVMIADDIVIAKSAFNHSINYRSVIVFSNGEIIDNDKEKAKFFELLTEKIVPNSWDYLRPMTSNEIAKTMLVKFEIKEASAKQRSGEPTMTEDEENLKIWTGTIPLISKKGEPKPSSFNNDIQLPIHLKQK